MRVGPVGFACGSIKEVLAEARLSAEVTHNHPEGVKGAQAVALAVYLARTGAAKSDIRQEISDRFGYNLNRRLDDIR
jgi:ADP-ribosyl-[dinitrogen reductase] hydrolase